MTFFNKKLISNIVHNGKKFLVSNKYMSGNPTCLTITTSKDNFIFKIKCLTQFSSCKEVVVDWGDGVQDVFEYNDTTRIFDISHTYANIGTYDILISNSVSKLEVVDIDDNVNKDADDNVIRMCLAIVKLKQLGSNVKEIGEECFIDATNMVEANFENSNVASIKNKAFYNTGITTINIPNSVTAIEDDAFAECDNLKSITVDGSNLTSFGANVCKNNFKLQYVDLPYSINDDAESAFFRIGAFTQDAVKNPYAIDLSIPDGWKSIPKSCFAGIPQLSSCVIPSTVTEIQASAFADSDEPYIEDGINVAYSPCVNGLRKIIFTGSNVYKMLQALRTTLKKTFSTTGNISKVEAECYDSEVVDAVKEVVEPKIDLTFLNDSEQEYQYWKDPCCNKSLDDVMSALVKYTNYFNTFPTTSCQYAITQDVHTAGESEIWGDIEQFDIARYTIERADADTLKNSNEVIVSGLVYTPQPTVLTIQDPDDAQHREKDISVYNSKSFMLSDLHQLQNDVIRIDFGKYSTLSIGDNALSGCTKLSSVSIPATVTYVGKYAFANVTTLKNVQFKRSRSVFVDEHAFENTPQLTSFTSEFDKASINSAEFIQLAEDTSAESFKNSGVNAKINFPDAKEIAKQFNSSNIQMLAYPKATTLSVNNAFENANNLQYLVVPMLSCFEAENTFYRRSDANALTIDMKKYPKSNDVPTLNKNFFKTGTNTNLSNFSICIPYNKYGDWATAEEWNKFNGKFESISYSDEIYTAFNIRESLTAAVHVDRANLPDIQFRTSALRNNRTDKITRLAVQTATDGTLPVLENLKLVVETGGSVFESLPIVFEGEYNTKLDFLFDDPVPANKSQILDFKFFNNEEQITLRIAMVKGSDYPDAYSSNIGPIVGNGYIPAIDLYATTRVDIKSSIENPTSLLFNEYAFENTTLILNKEQVGSEDAWTLNGLPFEPMYGTVQTEVDAKQLIYKYNLGQITPDIQANITYLKFTDGTSISASFAAAERTLTKAMLARFIPFEKELMYIKVGNSIDNIEENTFEGQQYLKTVILPDGIQQIPDNAFSTCDSLNAVYVGEVVQTIGQNTFKNCYSLSTIYIPESVNSLDADGHQFENAGLQEIILPDNIQTIPANAFANCHNLTSIQLGRQLTAIDDNAFYGCDKLENIAIPRKVSYIGNNAFMTCSSLKCVSLRNTVNDVPELGDNVFGFTPDELSIYVTDAMYKKFCAADDWMLISAKIFADNYPANNTFIGDTSYILTSITAADVAASPNPTYLRTGFDATTIETSAFSNCQQLSAAYINKGISSINDYAFASCSNLQYATIPSSVADNLKTRCSYIFKDCKNLVNVEIAEGVKSLSEGMFYNAGLVAVEIPNSLTSIGDYAFYGCKNIEKLTIPTNVEHIGDYAFDSAGITIFDCVAISNARRPRNLVNVNAFINVIDDDFKIYVHPNALANWRNDLSEISEHIIIDPRLTRVTYSNGTTEYLPIEGELNVASLENASDITSMYVGTNVTSIIQSDETTTTKLSNLQNLEIDNGCKVIGANVFKNANALSSVQLPSTIQSIKENAFGQCENLTTVTIADGVQGLKISNGAFDSNIVTFTFGFGTYEITQDIVTQPRILANAVIRRDEDNINFAKARFNKFEYINAIDIEFEKFESEDSGPLCFKATIQNSQVYLKASNDDVLTLDDGIHLIYSVDNKLTWNDYNWNNRTGEVITLNDNDKVYFRARNYNETISRSKTQYIQFVTIGRFEVHGNIQTLIDCMGNKTNVPDYCYYNLFQNCNITTAPALPAYELGECCYASMFANCAYLKDAPILPATIMAPGCYMDMFNLCLSLSKVPQLNSTQLAENCYARMFKNCISITLSAAVPKYITILQKIVVYDFVHQLEEILAVLNNPVIPLDVNEAEDIFSTFIEIVETFPASININTSDLTTFDKLLHAMNAYILAKNKEFLGSLSLPAVYLYDNCYLSMFQGCKNITTTPIFATNPDIKTDCYIFVNGKLYARTPALDYKRAPDFDERTAEGQILKYCWYNQLNDEQVFRTFDELLNSDMTIVGSYYCWTDQDNNHIYTYVDSNSVTENTKLYDNYKDEHQLQYSIEKIARNNNCYTNMFTDCVNLNEATLPFMDAMPEINFNSYGAWMQNVSPTGTIYLPAESKANVLIPPGWTRTDITTNVSE